ncbi:MAG: molybdopterin-dependent oxidoreductase, partial [Bacteroidota bacterium]|nr:molybdopterin-dependent oxidoreductase [Bacteroidota bacterium]
MSNKIDIFLNDNKVTGYIGESILDVATRNNIKIPTLCHDPRLKPYSSCYVCIVEVDGMRGLQPSCSTKISEGMKIKTDTQKVYEGRKASLDLLLSNHYADCIAPCKDTCPAGVDVQGYISLIDKGMYHEAVALIKETNPLPAICGRVCVRPCEAACRRNLLDEKAPVGIDYMKRFVSDFDLNSANHFKPKVEKSTGKKVAIIGGGPGGLSVAYFLQQKGHQCDIFEAAPHPGGWLRYGIPEYRLPNDILDAEIKTITELGTNIYCNKEFGKDISYKEIQKDYDSCILTIGSQHGTLVGCEGDDAENVYSGIIFLKNMEVTGNKPDFSNKKVIVVGGGNTAMDCCRTSIRLGSTDVKVVYRRTEKEMPANPIEIHESKIEGVEYLFLTNPKVINKDKDGKLKSMTCLKMKLGEPDASGRRRPIPIEGSEYEIEVDYILAAIGQKTKIDFLEDINTNTINGELKPNKWGDIDVNPKTLQTGIESVFAAGDGVSGPATIIEAIAQAQIASLSCHQYLTGQEIKPKKKEFLSKKSNFKEQIPEDYENNFKNQEREEMPTLDAGNRINFAEVELGYESEDIVQNESKRCLECGCTEYFTCDLKKHSTEYDVDQTKFAGEFNEYAIDFSHPFIEIDNNKCILCSRCVRICKEVVGANALGLVNRGFDTYVAPSMGKSLTETTCESCGMCISSCPTGAITENFDFKPGPVELEQVETICNYCSIGCKITLNHKNNFVMKVTGAEGEINKTANICRYPKFGYQYFNDSNRITKPLLMVVGKYKEISFDEAFDIIHDKIKNVNADENAFYAGARLTNEEMYLISKLATIGAKTNNVSNFHYLDRGFGYANNSVSNVPFDQVKGASKFYFIGSEINNDNAVLGFDIYDSCFQNSIPTLNITTHEKSTMAHKVDKTLKIKSYYYFVKSINHYLLSKGLENALFIKDNTVDFENYKTDLLKLNFEEIVKASGIDKKTIIEFAKEFNLEMNAIIVFSEKEVSANTSYELFNLALITGKLGKTSSGLIALKEKNNSHGLFDMGMFPELGIGGVSVDNKELTDKIKEKWKLKTLAKPLSTSNKELLENGKLKNILIFGEDPIGTAIKKAEVSEWFKDAEFVMVQDYFMTETAKNADLILPASFPIETGGSFTNTQKVIQNFEKVTEAKISKTSYEQLLSLLEKFGSNSLKNLDDVSIEAISMLPIKTEKEKFEFIKT